MMGASLQELTLFSFSVSCSVGTFYSGEQEQCVQCPPGTYQDTVGQLSCEPCPSSEGQGIAGAKNVSQCGGNTHLILSLLLSCKFVQVPFHFGLTDFQCHRDIIKFNKW